MNDLSLVIASLMDGTSFKVAIRPMVRFCNSLSPCLVQHHLTYTGIVNYIDQNTAVSQSICASRVYQTTLDSNPVASLKLMIMEMLS